MKHLMCLALMALIGLGCSSPRRVAQQSLEERPAEIGQPTFFVDWSGFKGADSSLSHLEIYYQVFNFGLQFLKTEGEFEASYAFAVVIADHDGKQVRAQEQNRKIRVENYDKTISRFDFRTSQISFDIPPGDYKITATLTDQNSKSVSTRTFGAELKSFRSEYPVASDPEFAQAAFSRPEDTSVFDKGSLRVIPSPSRYFGGDDSTKLIYYFEIYRGIGKTDHVNVETVIRSLARNTLYRDTVAVALDQDVIRQLREVSIEDFSPGEYELQLRLLGRRNKPLDEHMESFSIQWTQEGLLKHDFKTALEQLQYIAPSSEIKKMKNLQTLEERVAAFDAFWVSRDPSPGTKENEAKREFYRRVTFANRQFRHLRQEGWRTDRGRIYVQYGEPDQIDDVPMSLSYAPYQIWHYYREGRYRRFAFIDQNEDGDYRLQYPFDGLDQRPDF